MSAPTSTKIPSKIDSLYARAYFYRLLSFLLRHPLASGGAAYFLELINEWELALDSLPHQNKSDLHRQIETLFQLMENTDEKVWAQQYEQILGHTANSKVPSYELEYGEEHSHRQPQQLADIAAFYRAFGATMDNASGERVDHAAAECEFLYFLCLKESYALEIGQGENASMCEEAARTFLSEHLSRWFPTFLWRLSKISSGSEIMGVIARLGLDFVLEDCKLNNIRPGPEDLAIRPVQEKEETGCVSCVLNPVSVPSQ